MMPVVRGANDNSNDAQSHSAAGLPNIRPEGGERDRRGAKGALSPDLERLRPSGRVRMTSAIATRWLMVGLGAAFSVCNSMLLVIEPRAGLALAAVGVFGIALLMLSVCLGLKEPPRPAPRVPPVMPHAIADLVSDNHFPPAPQGERPHLTTVDRASGDIQFHRPAPRGEPLPGEDAP